MATGEAFISANTAFELTIFFGGLLAIYLVFLLCLRALPVLLPYAADETNHPVLRLFVSLLCMACYIYVVGLLLICLLITLGAIVTTVQRILKSLEP